jgi:hypothetical protein
MTRHLPLDLRRLALAALAASLLAAVSPGQDAPQPSGADAAAFLDRVEAAWQTRDLEAWLALREFTTAEERELEVATIRAAFQADETVFSFLRRPALRAGESRFVVEVQVFTAEEPRARVVFWSRSKGAAAGPSCRGWRARWTASST